MADETCLDETMRDLLPLLAHDALEGSEATALRAHVAACAACRAELVLIESAAAAINTATPQVSTASIVAGVQRATRLRLEPAATRPARARSQWMPRRYAAAAASIILVASASLAVLARNFGDPGAPTIAGVTGVTTIDTALGGTDGRAMASAGAGISMTGGLSDLSEDELSALLEELDRVEATIAEEPASFRRALVDDQEDF